MVSTFIGFNTDASGVSEWLGGWPSLFVALF